MLEKQPDHITEKRNTDELYSRIITTNQMLC
jgi:hypothetical protein